MQDAPSEYCDSAGDDRAARAKASAAEAAICDRFGNPVLSLGVGSGVTRALAAIEDFSQAIPAFARFREAAARAQQAVSGRGDKNAASCSPNLAQDGDATLANETADPDVAAAAPNESAAIAAREGRLVTVRTPFHQVPALCAAREIKNPVGTRAWKVRAVSNELVGPVFVAGESCVYLSPCWGNARRSRGGSAHFRVGTQCSATH